MRPLSHSPTIPQVASRTYKTIDDKGRLTLGREFAGRTVQIEPGEGEIVLRFSRVVPEPEAWLWENATALGLVRAGLEQATRGELSDGPDLAAAFELADSIPDDEE